MSLENQEFNSMMQVASYDFAVSIYRELISLRERVEILEKRVVGDWLNRDEAMRYLSCKSTTLWILTKKHTLKCTYIGRKPLYSYESCRKYLTDNSVSAEDIELAFNRLLESKAKK